MAKTGRPTKRTPKMEEDIVKVLRLGLSVKTAAAFVGIAYDTLRKWRLADEDFHALLEKAQATAKAGVAAKLVKAIEQGNITATIFWLKSRTEEFREKAPLEVADDVSPDEAFL